MKTIIARSEMEKISVVSKNIFVKAVEVLELKNFPSVDSLDFLMLSSIWDDFTGETQVHETPTTIITVTADELEIEIKSEFLEEYLDVLQEVSFDAIEFMGKHKVLLLATAKRLLKFYNETIFTGVMNILEELQAPMNEFAKEKILPRFEAMFEKMASSKIKE